MEIRKNIKNHFFLFYLLTVAICFVLGYVLLVSLDKISNPTISELYVSIYTVITQFGMLIFPVLIIQSFVSDYKNKNILFYKLMGYNWLRYFFDKNCGDISLDEYYCFWWSYRYKYCVSGFLLYFGNFVLLRKCNYL